MIAHTFVIPTVTHIVTIIYLFTIAKAVIAISSFLSSLQLYYFTLTIGRSNIFIFAYTISISSTIILTVCILAILSIIAISAFTDW